MAKKARPRYPNKVRVRRRYLSQALLLLAVAGGIWFYYFIQSDPEFGSTLYRLGESLGESRKKIFSNNPENSPGSAQPRPSQSLQSPLKNPDAQTTPDGSRVKGEISRATIPAPPSSSRAAAAAAAKARKRTEQPVSSFSAPVKRDTVTVYTTPGQSAVRENKPGSGASSSGSGTNGSDGSLTVEEDSLADPPPLAPAEAHSAGEGNTGNAGDSPGDTAGDMPYDGMSLAQVAEELSRKYRAMPSGAWGERVTGVTTHLEATTDAQNSPPFVIALTFDACGGGRDGYDSELIEFLREHDIPATLFVTSLWLRKHEDILRDLSADPLFEIAAHGERHRPCSVDGKSAYGIEGTASMAELVREVLANAREIAGITGKAPLWFRSGTAFYDELAVEVIQDLGMGIAGYSIPGDEGATLPASKVEAKTLQAKNGDILLFHMNKPRSGTREGLKKALPVLLRRGAKFVRLSEKY